MNFDDSLLYRIETSLDGTRYSLFDLAIWKNGFAFKRLHFSSSGIPIIKIAELNNGIGSTTAYTNQIFPDEVYIKKGDLLFSWSGNPHTSIDIFRFNMNEGWLNQHIFKVTPNTDIVDFDFFYFLMKYLKPYFTEIAVNKQTTGLGHVTLGDIKRMNLVIPSIDVQKRIVSVLKPFDDKISCNQTINDNLLQQAEVVFSKYYDASAKRQSFTSLISVLGGGTPKTGNSDFWGGFIPFFTPKDAVSPYTFQTEKYITESGLEQCNSRLYPKNTSFVTARGTVGKVSLAGKPMAMNQSCYALVSNKIDPVLVYFYVLKVVASLKYKASGAVFDAIVTRDFDTEIINVLTEEDSETVLSTISPMMAAIHNNIEENIWLITLRDTLLTKLMSGELDISSIDF